MMKKRILKSIVSVMLILTLVVTLASCFGSNDDKKTEGAGEITLMTWGGDFIPREIINEFETQTGIKVNYKEVASNEEMQELIKASPDKYDLAVATDYMIDIMRQEGMLQVLDKSKIPNIGNINPVFQKNYYDETDEYSIPYAVSISLLLVNPEEVIKTGAKEITGYADLWQPELKKNVVVVDWVAEVMGFTLKSLGYKFTETDPAIIEKGRERLFELRPNIVRFETNTPEDSLINGDAVAGYMYSNQAVKGQKANPKLKPVFPKEGMPIYIDGIVMSKDAPNKDNTYKLLNFLLDPKISAKISALTNFTSANKAAEEFLPEDFKNNPLLNLSDEVIKNTDFYVNVAESVEKYGTIFEEFKLG